MSVVGHNTVPVANPPLGTVGLPAVVLAPNQLPLFLFHHRKLFIAS
jgi:hypothetical protein